MSTRWDEDGKAYIYTNAIAHRELLKPGPDVSELKIKISPYQQQVRGLHKRKADAVELTSATANQDLSDMARIDDQSNKALKVIEHKFWNGDLAHDQSAQLADCPRNDDAATMDQITRSRKGDGGLRATPSHLVYKTPHGGKWRPTQRQHRQYAYGTVGHGQASDDVLDPALTSSHPRRPRSPGSTVTDEVPTTATTRGNGASTADVPTYDPDAGFGGERTVWTPVAEAVTSMENLPWNGNRINRVAANPSYEILPYDFESGSTSNTNDRPGFPPHYPTTAHTPAGAPPSYDGPELSIRDMAVRLHPVDQAAGHDQVCAIECTEEQRIRDAIGPVVTPMQAPSLAGERIGESCADDHAHRQPELASGQSDQTTLTPWASASAVQVGATSHSASTPHSTDSNTPELSDVSRKRKSKAVSTRHGEQPPRFRNQDRDCLVCLQPVTAAQLAIIDLRCVDCPRVFHGHCVTYVPPRGNQNWRCSLCYKEGWHGYGHLPAERNFNRPTLVERYRRRLLLAKTYGNPRESGSIRFWFNVDMDDGIAIDQAVLVRMGVANRFYLRSVAATATAGHGQQNQLAPLAATIPTPTAGGPCNTVEEKERWAIALGISLQQRERQVEAMQAEINQLTVTVAEREGRALGLQLQVDRLKAIVGE